MNDIMPQHIRLNTIQKSVLNSVRRRLNADKPFAFLLSGGVDSSLVAAVSAKILGKPIRTFCCGIGEGTYSVDGSHAMLLTILAQHILMYSSRRRKVLMQFQMLFGPLNHGILLLCAHQLDNILLVNGSVQKQTVKWLW